MRAPKFLMIALALCLCVVTACQKKGQDSATTSLSQAMEKQVQPQTH